MPSNTLTNSRMVVIKPNDFKVNTSISDIHQRTTSREALMEKLQLKSKSNIQHFRSEHDDNLIRCEKTHPLVQAASIAFSDNVPLVLTPNIIWYVISSTVATDINLNSEELRNTFVNFDGIKQLKVRRGNFRLASNVDLWYGVVDEFCAQIGENTKNGIADKLINDFSTVSDVAKVSSQVVLMEATKKYFQMRLAPVNPFGATRESTMLSGIPEIRLSGDRDDWDRLKVKANGLIDLLPDLSFWRTVLNEVMDQFISAFDGKIDQMFWNNIYKEDGLFMSGWLFLLFPYLSNGKRNPYFKFDQVEVKHIDKDFDYQMSQVPFLWNYYGTHFKMLFVAGLLAVHCGVDGALTPVLGYSIADDVSKEAQDGGGSEKIEKKERIPDLTGQVSVFERVSKFFVCGRN